MINSVSLLLSIFPSELMNNRSLFAALLSLAFETEPTFANPFIPALQDYYKEILDIAWASLDPNELTTLKKYVKEIREKKKY
jgi:hypothetical protein